MNFSAFFPNAAPGFISSIPYQGGSSASQLICYNEELPWEWRYRLGVRTEDSQSSNPGSIPGSATITAAITYAISEHSQFLPLWPFLWPPYCTVSDNC